MNFLSDFYFIVFIIFSSYMSSMLQNVSTSYQMEYRY